MEVEACAVERLAAPVDFETVFRAHYARVARVIDRVVQDHSRAEELAVEVFLKYWSRAEIETGAPQSLKQAWLYRVAVRAGLDELRRRNRRASYERVLGWVRLVPTPEEIHAGSEEQERVRCVLTAMNPRQGELLLLRSDGLSYEEMAGALGLNPASIGTLLARAQETFRKRFVRQYGRR